MKSIPEGREPVSKAKGQAGAKEVLTLELAKKIVRMIQDFPDAGIPVTWEQVIEQTKRRFGKEFRRNVLGHKEWDGRRLIHEAFKDAKLIQRRSARDMAPKYAKEPRSRLRLVVAKLQAENLALREALAQVRAAQYDELFSLLDTRTPLNRAVDVRNMTLKNSNPPTAAKSPPEAPPKIRAITSAQSRSTRQVNKGAKPDE